MASALAVLLAVGFWPRLLTDIIKRSVETTIVSRMAPPEPDKPPDSVPGNNLVKR